MKPMIVAHGGAWDWDEGLDAAKRSGVEAAVRAGQKILDQGGAALDAVHQMVLAPEEDPAFDAGTGGFLNRGGEVQRDASIIGGASVDFGAIAGVRRVRNPITLNVAVESTLRDCDLVSRQAIDLRREDRSRERKYVVHSRTKEPVRFQHPERTHEIVTASLSISWRIDL